MSETPQNVFLTENRRDVLTGQSDWKDVSIENEKRRIISRANMALVELTEVAQSPEIDNDAVFDPDLVETLVRALIEQGGRDGEKWEPMPDDAYSNRMKEQLAKVIVEADYRD